jgi:hypothetical protein
VLITVLQEEIEGEPQKIYLWNHNGVGFCKDLLGRITNVRESFISYRFSNKPTSNKKLREYFDG